MFNAKIDITHHIITDIEFIILVNDRFLQPLRFRYNRCCWCCYWYCYCFFSTTWNVSLLVQWFQFNSFQTVRAISNQFELVQNCIKCNIQFVEISGFATEIRKFWKLGWVSDVCKSIFGMLGQIQGGCENNMKLKFVF